MHIGRNISDWLVLGPIFNPAHQTTNHYPGDGHPVAAEIIKDIDDNVLSPFDLTDIRLLGMAPKDGDSVFYGNGKVFEIDQYTWRALNFGEIDWSDNIAVGDNIHRWLGTREHLSDNHDQTDFAEKHHALVFFLLHFYSLDERKAILHIRSDDSVRVWLNGAELGEPFRHEGDRDISTYSQGSCAKIPLRRGFNILLAAIAETHVEWGFSARIIDANGLKFYKRSNEYITR